MTMTTQDTDQIGDSGVYESYPMPDGSDPELHTISIMLTAIDRHLLCDTEASLRCVQYVLARVEADA